MVERKEKLDAPSLPEFFRELVRGALDHQKIHVPEGVEFYLVNLLREFAKTEGLHEEPLAMLFLRALRADTLRRVNLLRRLGDLSLYISGFFPHSLTRQLVDIRYYVQMGEGAYGSLSRLLARHAAFAEIFTDLAQRFVAYVDILSEVSERSSFVRKDAELLRLYETWLKTGSERARRLLSEEGILPINTSWKKQ